MEGIFDRYGLILIALFISGSLLVTLGIMLIRSEIASYRYVYQHEEIGSDIFVVGVLLVAASLHIKIKGETQSCSKDLNNNL